MQSDTSPSPIQLDEIEQIAISVSDLGRSKDYYQNVLGMRFLFDAGGMSFFQCRTIRFALGATGKPVPPSGTILYFRVSDLQESFRELSARGVEFIQVPHLVAKMADHDLWLAFLSDPDKNTIGLMSEVPHAGTLSG